MKAVKKDKRTELVEQVRKAQIAHREYLISIKGDAQYAEKALLAHRKNVLPIIQELELLHAQGGRKV